MDDSLVDTGYDVRLDSDSEDPDGYSLTLNKYHATLWNKRLPNGELFQVESSIDDFDSKYILTHHSTTGGIVLSSDIIITTYTTGWSKKPISKDIIPYIQDKKKKEFDYFAHTIGAFIVFPKRKNNGNSINQNRGVHPRIYDRFDITLECIRSHYLGLDNPLAETLDRYDGYFRLFGNFMDYCTFFLLQDLISDDGAAIKPFLPFDNFDDYPLPKSIVEYEAFMENCIVFIKRRNERIGRYVNSLEA